MLPSLLDASAVSPPLPEAEAQRASGQLAEVFGCDPYPNSIVGAEGAAFFLLRKDGERLLGIAWSPDAVPACAADFRGDRHPAARVGNCRLQLQTCPLDQANAEALRRYLPFTVPELVGIRAAFGAGDRLGLATPAHVRAVRGSGLRPFFAQQSIREMTRTGRTPQEVMDSAAWGVFQEGYRDGFGADADHLKMPDDIDATVAAGFTMYTIDPGDHVDNAAETDDVQTLMRKFEALPWPGLETAPDDLLKAYVKKSFRLPDDSTLTFDDESLLRAAVKYGGALAHTAAMYQHLVAKMSGCPFELEMSVDETATPTSVAEHFFVATELRRLGVQWVSLAPRFVGEFEKGVDYRGDLAAFGRSFAQHVAVARHLGPYKVSIHSGSDKFSIYPIAARLAGQLVHLKTAGTSYLEALRAVAKIDSGLFREILGFAIARYPADRASYHVSAEAAKVPPPDSLGEAELAGVLDQFDAREVLHVTFGSVLTAESEGKPRFRERLMTALSENEEIHYETVRAHIERHVRPFAEAR